MQMNPALVPHVPFGFKEKKYIEKGNKNGKKNKQTSKQLTIMMQRWCHTSALIYSLSLLIAAGSCLTNIALAHWCRRGQRSTSSEN